MIFLLAKQIFIFGLVFGICVYMLTRPLTGQYTVGMQMVGAVCDFW
jgi:hypothetical protein